MIRLYSGDEASAWLVNASDVLFHSSASQTLRTSVEEIATRVRKDGDAALHQLAARFGDQEPTFMLADSTEACEIANSVEPHDAKTMSLAAERIRRFADAVMQTFQPTRVVFDEYEAGLQLAPVASAACYVPSGRYPLPSTALMTAITAQVAGVKRIAIITPKFEPSIVFAGKLAGATEFYQLGGAQAIAAAAYGTATIMRFDMVVGPGNAYVAEAKRQLQGIIGIDMLAGPSEVAVIADAHANPDWVALDLLSQAEHDPDARPFLLTDSLALAEAVKKSVVDTFEQLALPAFVYESLDKGAIVVFKSLAQCVEAANVIAPEHLVLNVQEPDALKPQLTNYGALFMGAYATVPFGDYAAGPNHTLPTSRAARFSGALNPLAFLRAQTWLSVPGSAPTLAAITAAFARLEGLTAHAAAAESRMQSQSNSRSK